MRFLNSKRKIGPSLFCKALQACPKMGYHREPPASAILRMGYAQSQHTWGLNVTLAHTARHPEHPDFRVMYSTKGTECPHMATHLTVT